MAVFVTRPARIEAVQWTGENGDEVRAFAADMGVFVEQRWVSVFDDDHATFVRAGDWLIREGGRYSSMVAAEFEKRYRPCPSCPPHDGPLPDAPW